MPLYELIVVTRAAEAKGAANLLSGIASAVFREGGVVRDMNVLGDRILAKHLKGKDGNRHLVGRYLQILFDGSPYIKRIAETQAREDFETLRARSHRVEDFFSEAILHKKAARQRSTVTNDELRNTQYVKELATLLMDKAKLPTKETK